NSLKALLSVGELAHCRALAAPLARWSSSDSSAARNRRQSPSRGNRQRRLAKNADNAVAMAKSELNSSELLASSAESALDELSGMVASPALASRIDDKLADAKRRTRRSAAIRAAATRYLPALAAGEASVLLYCARRQAVLLHRSDPEAEAALASSRTDLEAARQELSLLVAKLSQRKADSPESERYQFKRRLEGFDFSEKFIYDK
ncbi:hypothetical protein BOX15_Mlig011006g1, partial [Macrostomum lignano]